MRTPLHTLCALLLAAIANSLPLSAAPPDFVRQSVDAAMAGDCKMTGDIDGDGFLDVAVAGLGPSEPLTWYRFPDWHETHIAASVQEWSNYGTIADVDGDGNNDIILPDATISPSNLFWFKNPGGTLALTGANWTKHAIGQTTSWCKDVFAFDFDNDGLMDVAARPENAQPAIFFQTSPGTWSKVSLSGLTVGHEGMGAADIDADGDVDIIVKGQGARNPGGAAARTPGSWSAFSIGSAPDDFKAFVADMNGDGRQDVLYSSSEGTANVIWYEQPASGPTGTWTLRTVDTGVTQAHTLWAADHDADGDNDVFIASMAGQFVIYENLNGAGTSWDEHLVDSGTAAGIHNGQVADLDQDGDPDLFGAGWTGQPAKTSVWFNQANPRLDLDEWTYIQLTDAHSQTFGLTFGDVDRDGRRDVISGPAWYRNPGGDLSGTWTRTAFPANRQAVLTAIVDNDAFIDVIAMNTVSSITSWYWLERSNAAGSTWTEVKFGETPAASHALGPQGFRYKNVVPGGKPEIVVTAGDGAYYFSIPASNPGAGNWPKVKITGSVSDEEIDVGDIDQDGYPDMVGTTGDTKLVRWYRNPGTGAANWTQYAVGSFPEAVYPDRCSLADLDGDGRLDVIVTEENGGSSDAQTYWWKQPATNPQTNTWTRQLIASQASTHSLDVRDMDRDGDIDVLLAEHRGGLNATLWENSGSGSFTSHAIGGGHESHNGGRTVDLDGDGDYDLVSIAYDAPQHIHLWRNDAAATNALPQVALPVITPAGGTFQSAQSVTISCSTGGAQIRYTLDGTDPTESSALYGSALLIAASTTVKARAFAVDFEPSAIATAVFTIEADTTAPTIQAVAATGSATLVTVLFSEVVEAASAELPGNYTIAGLTITGASLQSDGRMVWLTTSIMSDGATYTLQVSNVRDVANPPNTIAPASQQAFTYSPVTTLGLIHYWPSDEGKGTTTADLAGNKPGTLSAATWSTEGKAARALSYNGSALVNLGAVDIAASAATWTLWIRPASFTAGVDARLLSKTSGTGEQEHYWMLSLAESGGQQHLRVRLRTGGSTGTLVANASGTVSSGVWTHVAAVYDGSQLRLYKNASLVGTLAKTGAINTSAGISAAIGSQPPGAGGNGFNGLIDEVRIYNRALSVADLQAVMNFQPGPVDLYRIWAGDNDLSGSNNGLDADPDFDQIPNIMEYGLGGDPLERDFSMLQPRPYRNSATGMYGLEFRRAVSAMNWSFEYSESLAGWQSVAGLEGFAFTQVGEENGVPVYRATWVFDPEPAALYLRAEPSL